VLLVPQPCHVLVCPIINPAGALPFQCLAVSQLFLVTLCPNSYMCRRVLTVPYPASDLTVLCPAVLQLFCVILCPNCSMSCCVLSVPFSEDAPTVPCPTVSQLFHVLLWPNCSMSYGVLTLVKDTERDQEITIVYHKYMYVRRPCLSKKK
jgi:hypothetical protein